MDFQLHRDPGNVIEHVHSSQDGLHLVNVVDGRIFRNDIWAQDSGIAVEANPLWDWMVFEGTTAGNSGSRNIMIEQNFVQTNRGSGVGKSALTDANLYGD
jgi:hypothetical protein